MANSPPLLPVDAPLGAKIVDFLSRSLVPMAVAASVLGLLSIGLGLSIPRPAVDSALIEIGVRFLDDPLEPPIRSTFRLTAICREIADRVDPSAEVEVRPRRDEKSNSLTRVLEIRVEASTSSAARTILEQGLAQLIAEHEVPFAYERTLLERQLKSLEAGLVRLEAVLDHASSEERGELAARLYETRRGLDGVSGVLAKHSLQPTRIVTRASRAEPERSRVPVLLLGGLLLGAMLGAAWSAARMELARPERVRADADPFLFELFALTRRYRALIAILGVGGAIAGAAIGAFNPGSYQARAVVEAGEIPPKGPIEDLVTTASGLEAFISGRVIAGALPEGTLLEARVIRDQPPSVTKQALIELLATSPSYEGAEQAVKSAAELMIARENPEIEAERARIEQLAVNLEADLARLDTLPETLESHELRVKLVVDSTDLRRRLSSVRVHPARLVMDPRHEPAVRGPRITGFAMALSLFGLMVGYFVAFFSAGIGYLRGIKSKGTE